MIVSSYVKRIPELTLHFDLAELAGYSYYTGVVFSAFVPAYGRAVARGGRYDGIGKAFGRARPATGFSTDLRLLRKLSPDDETVRTGILAPCDGDADLYSEISRLRELGECVVISLPGTTARPADMGCDRKLVRKDSGWVVAAEE